jgi:hypothetical protein
MRAKGRIDEMNKKSLLWGFLGLFVKNPGAISAGLVRFGKFGVLAVLASLISQGFWEEGLTEVGLMLVLAVLGASEKLLKEKWGIGLALALCFLLAQPVQAQTIKVEPTQISVGGGAMLGDNGIIASWDSAFAAVQWHGVAMFSQNVTTGVGIEIHPAAVLSMNEDGVFVQAIDQVDWRLWSMNRVKMSALQIPGQLWESMFVGTDLLIREGGSTDFTGGFSARLVYGVKEKAGPGWIEMEIYMFEKYRPVSFAFLYRYNF